MPVFRRETSLFCPQCGTQNADNAAVCIRCGRNFAPAQGVVIPPGTPGTPMVIPNYLVPAIVVTILCCLPCGIAAIVYAAQVNSKIAGGDIAGAQQASKNAKMWCIISAVAGVAFMLCYGAFMFLAVMRHH